LRTIYPQDHTIIVTLNQILAKISFFRIHQMATTIIKNNHTITNEQKEIIRTLHSIWENLKEDFQNKQFELLKDTITILPKLVAELRQSASDTDVQQLDKIWNKLEKDYLNSDQMHTLMGYDSVLMNCFKVISLLLSPFTSPLKKEVDEIITKFFTNEKNLRSINKYYLIEDKGSFLSLYWFISDQNPSIKDDFQDISDRYFSLNPDRFHNLLGNVYLRFYAHTYANAFLKKAAECFNKAIKTGNKKPNYQFNLGQTYYKLGKYNLAEAAIVEAIRLSSGIHRSVYQKRLGAALNQLGNFYSSKGEYIDALD